jgi:hypothetical protein
MEYIEAPKNWTRLPDQPAVFLAGGITGCPDWQQEMRLLLGMTNYAVLNPRRKNFPIHEGASAAELQIKWEFYHLRKADVISFWFCKETVQPIVLYELGAWSMTDKPIAVGVEPGYIRELDVRIQVDLVRPDIRILTTLDDLANELRLYEPNLRSEILYSTGKGYWGKVS